MLHILWMLVAVAIIEEVGSIVLYATNHPVQGAKFDAASGDWITAAVVVAILTFCSGAVGKFFKD